MILMGWREATNTDLAQGVFLLLEIEIGSVTENLEQSRIQHLHIGPSLVVGGSGHTPSSTTTTTSSPFLSFSFSKGVVLRVSGSLGRGDTTKVSVQLRVPKPIIICEF